MSADVNKEILEELKKLNEKLDRLEEKRGLSGPAKAFALILGFIVVGPIMASSIYMIIGFFN